MNTNTDKDIFVALGFTQQDMNGMESLAEFMECDVVTLLKAIILNFGEQASIAYSVSKRVLFPLLVEQLRPYIEEMRIG